MYGRQTQHQWIAFLVLVLIPLLLTTTAAAEEPAPDVSWQVFRISGQRIGYGRTTERTIEEDGHTRIVTESVQKMTIRRFGQQLEMEVQQTFVESPEGELIRFTYIMDNPPNSHLETSGVVDGDDLRVTTTVLNGSDETILHGMAGIHSPIALDRSLEDDPLELGESRTQRVFFPEFNQAVELTVTAEEMEGIELYDGSTVEAMRLSMPNPLLMGVNVDSFYVEGRGLILSRTSLLEMDAEVVPAEVALAEVDGADLDIVVQSLVPVEGLENPHSASRIVYRITTSAGEAEDGFVAEGTQSVTRIDENTIELAVTQVKPEPPTDADPIAAPDSEYLESSSFLDCEDGEIRRLANEGAGELESPIEIAMALERFVHDRLTQKNFSTGLARASEVARTLSGDCTEHAVLLAALLRVNEIPSRVCVGLVYADSLGAFGGHMWTEAWLAGQWIPLDATLGAGGIGAGHLKLAHSSLSEEAPSPLSLFGPVVLMTGQLEIEVVEIEP